MYKNNLSNKKEAADSDTTASFLGIFAFYRPLSMRGRF